MRGRAYPWHGRTVIRRSIPRRSSTAAANVRASSRSSGDFELIATPRRAAAPARAGVPARHRPRDGVGAGGAARAVLAACASSSRRGPRTRRATSGRRSRRSSGLATRSCSRVTSAPEDHDGAGHRARPGVEDHVAPHVHARPRVRGPPRRRPRRRVGSSGCRTSSTSRSTSSGGRIACCWSNGGTRSRTAARRPAPRGAHVRARRRGPATDPLTPREPPGRLDGSGSRRRWAQSAPGDRRGRRR